MDWVKSLGAHHAINHYEALRPQVEAFHKTILQEFYQVAFNKERPHSGRYCYGKTPMQTFEDSKNLAKQKMLDQLVHPDA